MSMSLILMPLKSPGLDWIEPTGRQHHSCTVGSYQGQQGIFVTGGVSTANNRVEFLIDSVKRWRVLPAMSRQRQFHTSSFMGGTIFSFGGHDPKKRQTEINQE